MHKPPFRKLRGYAFDPSLSLKIDTASINNIVYKVEWEDLESSPVNKENVIPTGEYLEIIDYDPASGVFYEPVDLNDRFVLAQDGLDPSVGNPQFHQQMVYAVLMTTIKNFEAALGRKIQWSERLYMKGKKVESCFVPRLRVYPHALRQANAYYHPLKKALLFGYFPAHLSRPELQMPSSNVFTCLSHDIIAHEATHAIVDGLHRRYVEPTNPDTRAFHEAFADIVALFQHFTFPEVLKHQIAKTRGDLAAQNLLGQLAQEFGRAIGSYGSLRDAIGKTDPDTGKWIPHEPDPDEYTNTMEFHDRGAILVAAIFDAFLSIYKQRIKKLLRVATNGSGILPEGDLHPDLVLLLADYAADTASRILKICVRAIDYCPPVDITFGDYLRAIITSDKDMVADDKFNYRIAFIEAFQKRGIYPSNIKSMSAESLMYEQYPEIELEGDDNRIFIDFLKRFKERISYVTNRKEISDITDEFIAGSREAQMGLHARINAKFLDSKAGERFSVLSGLFCPRGMMEAKKAGMDYSNASHTAKYTVDKLWLANRVTPDGKTVNDIIITLTQKRGVIASLENNVFKVKSYAIPADVEKKGGFIFRGGCTLIFDLDTMKLKYAIKKDINDKKRIESQYRYMNGVASNGNTNMYFKDEMLNALSGPFAFMHSHNH